MYMIPNEPAVATWHAYHRELLTWVVPQKREAIIRNTKPEDEIKLRLLLMKPVKGELPPDVVAAAKQSNAMWDQWVAGGLSFVQKCTTHKQLYAAEGQFRAVLEKYRPELETLHKLECVSDCPWDKEQHTIFP